MAKGYSEAFSAEEETQMNEMRELDRTLPEEPEKPNVVENTVVTVEPVTEVVEEAVATAKPSMVPHAALHEEREARKAAEKSTRELTEQFARADERMKMIMGAQQQVAREVAPPDPDIDALGALKYVQTQLQQTQQQQTRQAQEFQQVQQINHIVQTAGNMERQYIVDNPDYNDASAYLLQSRFTELQEFGLTQEQANAQIENEKFQLAAQAVLQGKNAPALVMSMAKARGYTKKVAAASTAAASEEKLTNIAAGQKANASLSNVSGTSPKAGGYTARDLATMPDEEFNKLYASMTKAQQRAAFGD